MSRGIMNFRSGLAFLVLLISSLSMVQMAHAAASGTISGVVQGPTGQPEAEGFVLVEGTDPPMAGQTDSEGRFSIRNVPVGTYRLVVRKSGFEPISKAGVVVTANQVTTLSFKLTEGVAMELKPIEVQSTKNRIDRTRSSARRS